MKRLALLTLLIASSLTAQTRVTLGPERVLTTFARPTLIAAGAEGRVPAFAAAGRDGHYLIAWSAYDDATNTRASLHTAKIDSSGRIVEASRFVAPAQRTTDPNAQFPAVAFDGERFLVAWVEGSFMVTRVVAMRFDLDGKPLDPTPQILSLDGRLAPVAASAAGGVFTIAYNRWGTAPATVTATARMLANGTVTERDRSLPGPAGFWLDLESNPTSSLVAGEANSTVGCVIGFCMPVGSRAISRVGTTTAGVTNLVTEQAGYQAPVGGGVATDGERFLVVKFTPSALPGQPGWLVRSQLTDTAGTTFVRESLVARHPPATQLAGARIDAVWTGGSYAIAYERAPSTLDLNISLTFVSQIGMALTDPVEVAASHLQERTPVILPLSDARVLVLYERGEYERPEIVAREATLSMRTRAVR